MEPEAPTLEAISPAHIVWCHSKSGFGTSCSKQTMDGGSGGSGFGRTLAQQSGLLP